MIARPRSDVHRSTDSDDVTGTGEKITDIAEFDADRFVEALLGTQVEGEE